MNIVIKICGMQARWYNNFFNIQKKQYPDKHHGKAFRTCFILCSTVKHWQFSCGIPGGLLND